MNDQIDFIVCRQTDYKDNDVILGGLTPKGQMSFYAKGIKKPNSKNAYALQLYSHAQIEYDEKIERDIQLCKRATLIDSYLPIRENLDYQTFISVLAEIVLKIPDGEDLYTLLEFALTHISGPEPFMIFNLVLSKILEREGNQPSVDGCVICGNTKDNIAISIEDGGFVCKNCYPQSHGKIYTPEQLRAFRYLQKAQLMQWDKLLNQNANDLVLSQLLLDFFEYYTDIRLTSRKFFNSWFIPKGSES